ncbi:MAG: ABC transporter permease subunit [Microbacterium sp.]|uniref:ABC transporter permease n=1 Tax=Microbacterium sp. TaxID=51671 RepID=UPI002721FE04|nr:ABC transporter permease subunit [Microbacterium sp.]MDO8383874.1 ABC transporter permease subunit [Microbacterium sp.]
MELVQSSTASTRKTSKATRRRGRRSSLAKNSSAWLKGIAGLVAFGLVWDALRLMGVISPTWAPSSEQIVILFVQQLASGALTAPIVQTLLAWAVGLLLGCFIGVCWGGLMGASRTIGSLSTYVVSFLRPLPAVSLVPIAILLLGTGLPMVFAVVSFAVVWPMLFHTYYGVREVPGQYIETGRALGKNARQVFLSVTLVAAAPAIATGVRIAAGVALVVVVATQMIVGGIGGLGAYVMTARTSGNTDLAYVGLLAGGLIGVVVNTVFQLIQQRAFGWSPENRGEER